MQYFYVELQARYFYLYIIWAIKSYKLHNKKYEAQQLVKPR